MINELSVVLPVHNEEIGIWSVVESLVNLLRKKNVSFEILCIENGSTDNTLIKLKNLTMVYQEVKVGISEKGWGNAVRKGISLSKGKYICYTVSDNQTDIKNVLFAFTALKKNNVDMVKVQRRNREDLLRFTLSSFYNYFCLLIFGIGNDINATPKILERSLITKLNLKSENIAIDLELLLKLKKRRLRWINIPIYSKKRNWGTSTTNIKSIIEMLYSILKFRFSKT